MVIFIIWLALSFVIGGWNQSRGRTFIGGFFMSLLLSPSIALIIIAVRQPNTQKVEAEAVATGTIKCRYCGTDLPAAVQP